MQSWGMKITRSCFQKYDTLETLSSQRSAVRLRYLTTKESKQPEASIIPSYPLIKLGEVLDQVSQNPLHVAPMAFPFLPQVLACRIHPQLFHQVADPGTIGNSTKVHIPVTGLRTGCLRYRVDG